MRNDLKSLSEIFQSRLFRIPDYQRGYAWQQAQLVDFWDDLSNLRMDRYHYTGLLSLRPLKGEEVDSLKNDLWIEKKGFKLFHVVDGQQRLTTIVILLNEIINYIRSCEENDGKTDEEIVIGEETLKEVTEKYIRQKRHTEIEKTTYLFGYEPNNPSYEYLIYNVFDEPFSGEVNENYYTKNLDNARSFFAKNIEALYREKGIDGIEVLYQKITNNLMFNLHEIDDDYNVFIAFETMNNRGKKLSNLELLKNRLIYLTTIYGDEVIDEEQKTELRDKINKAWAEVYKQLGKNSSRVLSDDEYLRAHWIIYFIYSRKRGDDYIQYLLNKFSSKSVFGNNTIVEKEKQPLVYKEYDDDDNEEDEIAVSADEEEMNQQKLEAREISGYVDSLKELAKYWYDTHFPNDNSSLDKDVKLWLDRLNRIGISYFRPLVAVALCKSKEEEQVKLFTAIERFLFVCFRIGRYRSNYQSSVYYKAARELYHEKTTIEKITKALEKTTDDNIEYAFRAFRDDIKRKFQNEGKGYYDWNSLKYFMYEYEYNLIGDGNAPKILDYDLFISNQKDKVTIEHILPQTPTNKYWKNNFRQYIRNAQEMAYLTGALGNLLPLSRSINSSLQNDSFDEKKGAFVEKGRRGYKNGSYSEIEVSKEENWTAKEIHERTLRLLSFMATRWNIPFTDEQKKELAFDDFIKTPADLPEEESAGQFTAK